MAGDTQANSFFSQILGTQQLEDEASDRDHIEPRQANLFLIDTSHRMFQAEENSNETPFMRSVELYRNNMQMLCGFNRDDQMSLILFATNEWDKDPETKHVLTVQKFHKVTLEMLKEIKGKIEDVHERFLLLSATSGEYPLHDALWHSAQAFAAVKKVVISRKIFLFTCEDNPFANDDNERHRIRTRVATFKNLGIDFRVIGLKNGFDHNKFYKGLEIIASGMSSQIYKPLELNDLEAEIQFPSRTISNIPWRFSKDVQVPVSIFTIATETKFPDVVKINKQTNEHLKTTTVYRKQSEDGEDENVDHDENFNSDVVAAGGLAKYQQHGGKRIVFDVQELKTMFNHFEKGIDTICFKPIECDPMYHVEGPKFLTFSKVEATESQKQLFDTLVNKCELKELMIVCRINYRMHSTPSVYYLYPTTRRGGFFIYKMAYEDHVRNLDTTLSTWSYKPDWNHSPDEEALKIFEKIVKKTRIRFDPSIFKNPKLGALIANIEALALEQDNVVVPPDSTLPSGKIRERLEEVMPEYNEIFVEDEVEIPAKRMRISVDDSQVKTCFLLKTVDKLTVAQLKEFLSNHGFGTLSGVRKPSLVEKVYEFYRSKK